MQKTYSRINWVDAPNTSTPISASNLNKMDSALNEIDNRVVELAGYQEEAKASEENAKQSELLAKEYADRLFDATPEGYNEVVDTVEANREAIESIDSDLGNKIRILDMPNANCEFRFPTNEDGSSYYYLNIQPSALTYAHYDQAYGRTHYWSLEPPKWKLYGIATGNKNIGIPISTEILVEITFDGNSYTVLIPTHFITSNEKAYTFGHYYNSTENVYGYVSTTTERMRVIVFKNMVEVSSSASINIYYR